MSAAGRMKAVLVALPCAVALSACAIGPNYHRPSARATPVFSEGRGWTPATPAQIAPHQPWWSIYHDPTLDALERQVEVSNQNLKAAVAAFYAARDIVGVDRGTLFPAITATGSESHSGGGLGGVSTAGVRLAGSTNHTLFNTTASGSWQLDIWGRIRRTIESDVAHAQASAADVAAARLSAQVALAEDYFQLRASEQALDLLKTSVKDFKNAEQIARNRVNAGVTTLADVYSAQTEVENTQAQEYSQVLARARLVHAIAVLIGKPPSEVSIGPGAFAAKVPVIPSGLPSQLLQRRPDIAVSERGVASANAQIGVAEAAWFPSVTLTGSYGFSSSTLSTLIGASSSLWSVGPTLAETLFNGGARYFQNREARALYDEAVANYRETVLSALSQVENDLASLHFLQQQYAQEQAAVSDAMRSEALTLNQYKAGVQNYTAVLTAQTTRLSTEVSALSIQSQRLVASVQLIGDLGGGWNASQLSQHNYGVSYRLGSTVH